MLAASAPANIPLPWGNSAGAGYIRTIPTASQIGTNPGYASWPDGFVPLNMTPVQSGGVPPFGQDMNGVLNAISAGLQWEQVGGQPIYSSSYSTAIGGYPNGAILQSSDGTGFWRSIADSNTVNPDTVTAYVAGTTNWIPHFFYGSAAITLTNANVTTTAVQYAKPILILSGTLAANVNLVLPAFVAQWEISNNCVMGAYTITAKTAAGTGVTIQPGMRSVWGDGTNIYSSSDASAIQAQSGNVAGDTGTANAYAVTLIPAVTALTLGLTVRVKIANTNTGASTLNVNGLGAVAIRRGDGVTALIAGDLVAGGVASVIYDGTNFQLVAMASVASSRRTRTVLTSGSGTYTVPAGCRSLFVRSVGGGGGSQNSYNSSYPITTNAGTGGNTTFGTALLVAGGGAPGTSGGGGVTSGGSINLPPSPGAPPPNGQTIGSWVIGGYGGSTPLGYGGTGVVAAATGYGGGGGGGYCQSAAYYPGNGGGGGGYCEALITSPAATYAYAVGAAGTPSVGGATYGTAAAGGVIIIDEYY